MSIAEILFLCSILSSSDIVIAISSLNFETQPKLNSIILGEGLLNDAIVIILF